MHVVPPLPQSYASFEQQSTNLVDDCRATHHPTLAHAMEGLLIQLVISLDRHETHRRPCDSLSDRLGIDIVALVRFHVRLHILRRNQSHLVSLFPQCSAKKMRTSAGFHANQPDLYVGCEAHQPCVHELLGNHEHLTYQAKDLVKDHDARNQAAAQRIREFHPRFNRATDAEIFNAQLSLGDAQLTIAREYGFPSWARLKRHIEKPTISDRLDLPHQQRIENATFPRRGNPRHR